MRKRLRHLARFVQLPLVSGTKMAGTLRWMARDSSSVNAYKCSVCVYEYVMICVGIYCICNSYNWRAQWKKGISVFDNSKRSRVNKEFLLSGKITRLNFNSSEFQLMNFNNDSLLDNENASLTFDLLGLSKTVVPFSHWALQLFHWFLGLN